MLSPLLPGLLLRQFGNRLQGFADDRIAKFVPPFPKNNADCVECSLVPCLCPLTQKQQNETIYQMFPTIMFRIAGSS